MIKILVVEDEKPISNLIKINLADSGYYCQCAYDGYEAIDMIEKESYDLILLDIMLPKLNGYEIFNYIKELNIPVIFLTAKTDVKDKVKGLRLGAEDYITKPFEIMELIARVDRVLRRYNKVGDYFKIFHIEIDNLSRIVKSHGEVVNLTAKEYDLLLLFVQNKNIALFRKQIYKRVWGDDYMGNTRTVDLHVQRMRKKLDLEDKIVAVYKIGYRLEV
ncbi:MAG: response regulator transcription factor [Clostridium sp.]|nr:response regulator transcription factor [Clostridium sp.]